MDKKSWILGILISALISCGAENCFWDCYPSRRLYLCSEDGDAYLSQCHFDCLKKSNRSLGPVRECKMSKGLCFKLSDLLLPMTREETCSNDGLRYPSQNHLVCDKKTDWTTGSGNGILESHSANCSNLTSDVVNWTYNAEDYTFEFAPVTTSKDNVVSTTTSRAVTEKSGGNNPRPVSFGIVAAFIVCVVLLQI